MPNQRQFGIGDQRNVIRRFAGCFVQQVVERKGRWGRYFYGCRRYPECRFTAYNRPIPEACPDCGRSFLLEKETKKEGKVVFCGNEACHFKRQAA